MFWEVDVSTLAKGNYIFIICLDFFMMSKFNPARWVYDVELLLISELMLGIVCSILLPKLFMSY